MGSVVVLIVDDDDDMRRLAGRVLDLAGFEAIEIADGPAAIARLGEAPTPDAVLLDVQMPGSDGWTTLEAIRGDPRIAHLPVVFSTVKAHPRDALRGWQLGCDGYITKPYDINELGETLRRALDRDDGQRRRIREEQIEELELILQST